MNASAFLSSPSMTEGLAEAENSAKWPTPATRDHKGANSADHLENGTGRLHLDQLPNFVAHVWPTPQARDGAGRGADPSRLDQPNRRGGYNLDDWAAKWSTPRSSDGEKGGPNQSFGAGGVPLAAQTVNWSTPSVADVTGGRTSRSGDRKDELLLNSQAKAVSEQWMTPRVATGDYTRDGRAAGQERLTLEGQAKSVWPPPTSLSFGESHQPGNSRSYNITMERASSLRDQLTYPVGQASSPDRRSLNPLFVESLMGWPPGWTLVAWTDFGCSATALSRFKARMRFALSQLVSLPAPPAQLSLFG